MEETLAVLFGLIALGYLVIVPGLALAMASRANSRREELERRVVELEALLGRRQGAAPWPAPPGAPAYAPGLARSVTVRAEGVPEPAGSVPVPAEGVPGPAGSVPVPAEGVPGPAGSVTVSAEGVPEPAGSVPVPAEGAPAAETGAPAAETSAPAAETGAPAAETGAPAAETGAPAAETGAPAAETGAPAPLEGATAEGRGAPAPRPAAPPAPPPPRGHIPEPIPPRPSLEEHLGLTWLTRIGVAVFLLGALFFFKYAVDNAWIGPAGRVAIGALVGLALLGSAEITRARSKPAFVHALTGLGLATLFVAVWASAVFYKLIDPALAMLFTTVLLFLGAALALRYLGETILILTLVAGFLNPVILSTGQDRPLELFAYLLLVTSVVHAVAVRCAFRVAPVLAALGSAALFGGWYGKYFDAADRRAYTGLDLPPAQLVGPYFALGARVVPLAAVGLFAAQWTIAALRHEARDAARAPSPKPASVPAFGLPVLLALGALILAHAGAALLLFDAPRILAGLAILVALASIALLRRLAAEQLLVLPMAAAFLAFLVVSEGAPPAARGTLVTLLGLWTLVYLAGFLRGLGRGGVLPLGAAVSGALGVAFFDGLAAVLLATRSPAVFALLLGLSSVVVTYLAARSERTGLRLAALLGTALALVLTAVSLAGPGAYDAAGLFASEPDPVFLGAAFAWSLVYVVATLQGAIRRRPGSGASAATWTLDWESAITASLATLGFLAVALVTTGDDRPTLRALLTAAAGGVDLAAGAIAARALRDDPSAPRSTSAPRDSRRPREAREARQALAAHEPSALLVAEALGLFAAATAFALSGASITVVWAALAAVAAVLAARTEDRVWLTAAALLFMAALARIAFIDAPAASAEVELFFATQGRAGLIAERVLFNPRAYALAALGLSLLGSAYALTRGAGSPFRKQGAVAAGLGYILLLTLAASEVHSAMIRPPLAPPMPLDGPEWSAFLSAYDASLYAQRSGAAVSITLVMAVFAISLLVAGFAARDAFHRYLGLALFSVTVLKLALWDVWNIPRVFQIVLLIGTGALLVSGGFLYARFGRRLVALMRDGGAGGAAALLVLAALSAPARAEAADPPKPALDVSALHVMRAIDGIDAPGDYTFEVDDDLYRASEASALLGDVRVAGPDGAEVPFVVEEVAPPRPAPSEEPRDGVMLDPSLGSSGEVYATFRLTPRRDHCQVALDLEGGVFLREVKIETGEDPRALGLVVQGPYVYRVPEGGEAAVHFEVSYPRSSATLVRVTLLPERGGTQVRIRGGRFSCPKDGGAAATALFAERPLTIVETTRDPDGKTTRLTLDAGQSGANAGGAADGGAEGALGLPFEALRFDVATPQFNRRVTVSATSYRAVWPEAGGGVLYRVAGREGPIELLRVPIAQTRKRWFQLVVRDEDSAPLAFRGASGEVRRRAVTLRADRAGAHVLYAGDRMQSPGRYDLVELLARAEAPAPRRPAKLGPIAPNPRFGVKAEPAGAPLTERYRGPIGVALTVVLVALAIWAVRLLGKPPSPPPEKG